MAESTVRPASHGIRIFILYQRSRRHLHPAR